MISTPPPAPITNVVAPSAANFCCDAQLCPLVGFVLDGQFRMRRRKFIAFLGSARSSPKEYDGSVFCTVNGAQT
jgi:hypothetical protein